MGNTTDCDICGIEVSCPDGYLLTTKEVVGEPAYWRHYYRQHKSEFAIIGISTFKEFRTDSTQRQSTVKLLAQQDTPWLVCQNCVSLFNVNQQKTSKYAEQWWSSKGMFSPPGTGPALDSEIIMISEKHMDTQHVQRMKAEKVSHYKSYKSFYFEATTLEEARRKAEVKIQESYPNGKYSMKENVLTTGNPITIRSTGATIKEAYAKAERDLPANPTMIEKKVIKEPFRRIFGLIHQEAVVEIKSQTVARLRIKLIEEIPIGKKDVNENQIQSLRNKYEYPSKPDRKTKSKDASQIGIRRVVNGIVYIECPKCGTDYNRELVLAEIKKQSPMLFDSAVWTTWFICQNCRTEIGIFGQREST